MRTPRRPFRHGPALLALAILLAAALPAPARAARTRKANRAAVATGPRVQRSRPILDGVLDIVAASHADVTDTARASTAIELALAEASRLAEVFATDGGASELARLNRSGPDERFACSPDLYAALESALAVAAGTEGAYDPTSGPLVSAWALREPGRAPDAGAISDARALVGWRMLQLDPERRTARFLKPGMALELDAVSRDFVLDRAADVLRTRGIVRARLELGGDVLAFTAHEPWTASVPLPAGGGRVAMRLALSNAAFATAAQAGHGSEPVLDPRTGRPAPGEASATVVTRPASRARALAEALLVMGRDAAEAFARAHPDLGVLWLEPGGDALRAWAWNLGALEPGPGLRVEWMTPR